MANAFYLALEGVDAPVHVHSFRGTEQLSRAWRFDFVVSAPRDREIERVALGQRATAIIQREGRLRALYGIVARVTLDGAGPAPDRAQFRVRVVPRLTMLRRTKRSRIFQGESVPVIVATVLAQAGIAVRLR